MPLLTGCTVPSAAGICCGDKGGGPGYGYGVGWRGPLNTLAATPPLINGGGECAVCGVCVRYSCDRQVYSCACVGERVFLCVCVFLCG